MSIRLRQVTENCWLVEPKLHYRIERRRVATKGDIYRYDVFDRRSKRITAQNFQSLRAVRDYLNLLSDENRYLKAIGELKSFNQPYGHDGAGEGGTGEQEKDERIRERARGRGRGRRGGEVVMPKSTKRKESTDAA